MFVTLLKFVLNKDYMLHYNMKLYCRCLERHAVCLVSFSFIYILVLSLFLVISCLRFLITNVLTS